MGSPVQRSTLNFDGAPSDLRLCGTEILVAKSKEEAMKDGVGRRGRLETHLRAKPLAFLPKCRSESSCFLKVPAVCRISL